MVIIFSVFTFCSPALECKLFENRDFILFTVVSLVPVLGT